MTGERGAWEALVDRHGPQLLRALRIRCARLPGREAEEAFQALWIHLLENGGARLGGWDPERPLAPYLLAIALNLMRKRIAVEGRHPPLPAEGQGDPASPLQGPPERAVLEEERAALRLAFPRLDPRERLLLTLLVLEGLPQSRVAGLLGLAEGSVSVLARRARARLKELAFPD
jgi:RNA polymerase sigma factor (sigma-70 family)